MKNPIRKPTTQELAHRQLLEAERDLLNAHTQKEHFDAQVLMLEKRVERLRHQSAQPAMLESIPKTLFKAAA